MGALYASVADVKALKPLSAQEEEQAVVLLQYASDRLRVISAKYGCNIDALVNADESYASAVKFTVINTVLNALGRLSVSVGESSASQASQSGLGYSMTLTYSNAGSVLWFGKNDLKDLGLLRQKFGALDIYGNEGT